MRGIKAETTLQWSPPKISALSGNRLNFGLFDQDQIDKDSSAERQQVDKLDLNAVDEEGDSKEEQSIAEEANTATLEN